MTDVEEGKEECFVCGRTDVPLKKKRFCCLWYWMHELICEKCWNIPTDEPKEGIEW